MDEVLYRNRKPRDEGTAGLAMFDAPPYAPAQPRPTSEAAAVEISKYIAKKRKAVFVAICTHFELRKIGLTDNDLIRHFADRGWSVNTPRARRIELERVGLVEESGERDGCLLWRPTVRGWEVFLDIMHPEEAA